MCPAAANRAYRHLLMRNENTIRVCTYPIVQTRSTDRSLLNLLLSTGRTDDISLTANITTIRAYVLGQIEIINIQFFIHIVIELHL